MSPFSRMKEIISQEKIILLGLFISIVISFGNGLPNNFISDDIGAIVENKQIGDLTYSLFSHPSSFLESVTYRLFGLSPAFFHVNNILLHFGVTVLVYFIFLLVTENKRLSRIVAFLFAVHPIHSEAVTWISGLPYIFYTFFGLISLILYIAMDKKIIGKLWNIPAVLFLSLSFFTSEKAIIFPLIIGLYFLLFSSIKKNILVFIPIGVATFVFLLSLFGRFGERATSVNPVETGGTVYFNPLIQTPLALGSYIKLFLWPIPLTLYHESFFVTETLQYVFIIFLVVYLMSMIFFFYKNKIIFLGLSIFIIGLLPTLLPIQVSWIVAERYLYFPSLGLIIILSYGLYLLSKKSENIFWLIFLILFTFYSMRTIVRNTDWYNDDTFWPATVRISTLSSLAHNNMGDYYTRHGVREKAIEEFTKAIEIRPRYPEAYHNLGNVYLENHETTKAASLYQQALRYNPTLLISMINLAASYIELNDYDNARVYLEKAQAKDPNSVLLYNAWGVYYFQLRQYDLARQSLQKALYLDPNFDLAKENLRRIEAVQ